uniref:Uncharacterized protein n=1 Tax=viral metagenome TaxID=1070528 RepID=A0A6M3LTW6_9ZZZZ
MYMKTNERTTTELIEALKAMSVEDRISYLQATRPELFDSRIQTVSFGKAPKDGWKDSDRIAK